MKPADFARPLTLARTIKLLEERCPPLARQVGDLGATAVVFVRPLWCGGKLEEENFDVLPLPMAEARLRYERQLFRAFDGQRKGRWGRRVPPGDAIDLVMRHVWKKAEAVGGEFGGAWRRHVAWPVDRIAKYLKRRAALGLRPAA